MVFNILALFFTEDLQAAQDTIVHSVMKRVWGGVMNVSQPCPTRGLIV